jgi:hypothetical protein
MPLPVSLEAALLDVAEAVRGAREPWWIIGSAAVALHGAEAGEIGDIDLLMSRGDAGRLFARRGLPLAPGPGGPLFRSALLGRWSAAGREVEAMAGLEVCGARGWVQVLPRGRAAVAVAGATLFVPPRDELVAILRLFGREKDLARAAALEAAGRPRDWTEPPPRG